MQKCINGCSGEQNAHEGSIAVRAAILRYPERAHLRTPAVLGPLLASGTHCLSVMETQLKQTPYLTVRDLYRRRHLPLWLYAFGGAGRV